MVGKGTVRYARHCHKTLIIFCGNIIARDCCVVRAGEAADHWDIVNIRDKEGRSTWPSKNTEENIDTALSKISTAAQQTEYFNNPVTEGEVFKELTYGKVPALNKFDFLVIYGDPAPGENKSKNSSTKSCILMGQLKQKVYIINVRLDRGLNSDFIDWYVQLLEYVDGKTSVYCYMENNKLQDPFFSKYSNRWSVRCAGNGTCNFTSIPTKNERPKKVPVSKPTWNR